MSCFSPLAVESQVKLPTEVFFACLLHNPTPVAPTIALVTRAQILLDFLALSAHQSLPKENQESGIPEQGYCSLHFEKLRGICSETTSPCILWSNSPPHSLNADMCKQELMAKWQEPGPASDWRSGTSDWRSGTQPVNWGPFFKKKNVNKLIEIQLTINCTYLKCAT